MNEIYNKVRDKIFELVPDAGFYQDGGENFILEDVLRAINEVYYGINMTNEGTTVLSDEIVEIIGIWELGTSLKDQSPEVWEAIDKIL